MTVEAPAHTPVQTIATIDGNEAVASVAYRTSEVIAIYPITPSSPMGELADDWAAHGEPNVWGRIPVVVEMQSEGGAAGAVHGALTAGALATTFTASQGLLLMIPNMFKIAGELTPFVMHVAARSVATHALSIFGDHSDVMACRQTGFAMLASGTVQEAHDFACIAQAATLESRIPFLHFFDGFRTSHEINGVHRMTDEQVRALMDEDDIRAHRERALTPDRPVLRGTAQNPDTFFQAREACNPFYDSCADVVERTMHRFAEVTGRLHRLFEYVGHPHAERVVVILGSGGDCARETVEHLQHNGEKVGVVKVHLYRPFSLQHFMAALPATTRSIAVLDRTKEPGAVGEPLYLDVVAAVYQGLATGQAPFQETPRIIGGRYGISSKEFTPAMVKAIFDELQKDRLKTQFTVGITDDVTHLSLDIDDTFDIETDKTVRAIFHGLGSDGTVGANKSSIKIIGEHTRNHAQGYFVYDSKKAGARTISHLRFGLEPIHAPYLIHRASFVACHQWNFLWRYDVLDGAAEGATFLLNAPFDEAHVWDQLPYEVQEQILHKQLRLWVIDAAKIAGGAGLGSRINTVMQACFFALSGVLPKMEATARILESIQETYAKKGEEIVRRNEAAVAAALEHLHEATVPDRITAHRRRPPNVPDAAPEFVKEITAVMLAGHGDSLPVSAFPPDGTWPTGTAKWEKRSIASEIPIWDEKVCIQCNKCAYVCPHAAIRAKVFDPARANGGGPAVPVKGQDFEGMHYSLQVAPDDCTGCRLCVVVCPAKDKAAPRRKAINMEPQRDVLDRERERFAWFEQLPGLGREDLPKLKVRETQLVEPLFEYSGACAGCGETPYLKVLTQLFGDRLLIANATGCSSIYGGNLPTTPWTTNAVGRGPAWSNSLFEDNAEFGLGMRLAVDGLAHEATVLIEEMSGYIGSDLGRDILNADDTTESGIRAMRERIEALRGQLQSVDSIEARRLELIADYLVRKSVWLVGGDGWAFDIGYGGLDHVLSMDRNVNILVLDTEVYSNTGGQASKATPVGAAAKFASKGKPMDKKDLGLMAMNYGHVYVASVAFGAKDQQVVQAMLEADSYDGPSLVIAYSHCIAHGYDMAFGCDQQALAVNSGVWPLYRYDPRRLDAGEPPLVIDAKGRKAPVQQYMANEARFRVVEKIDPLAFRRYAQRAQLSAERRVALYEHMSHLRYPTAGEEKV